MAKGKTIASLLVKVGVQVKEFKKGMGDVGKGLKKTGKTAGKFDSIIGSLAKRFAVGFIATKAFESIKDFQTALAHLGTATNTTGNALKKMGNRAIELSNKFGISAEEVLHGMETLRNLGISTEETLVILPNILNVVRGTGADFAKTAAVMETVLNDFNLTAKDSAHITDVLVKTMRQGNFGIEAWREAMKEAGSAAGAAQANFEAVAVSLVVLGKAGITGGRAGTALRNIFLGISGELAKGAPLFKKYGIAVKNSDGTLKNYAQIIAAVKEKFKQLTPQQQVAFEKALVGQQAFSALDTIINRSDDDFVGLINDMKTGSGEAAKSSEDMTNTISGQWDILTNKISNFVKSTDGTIAGLITGILKAFNVFVDGIESDLTTIVNGFKDAWNSTAKGWDEFVNRLTSRWKSDWNSLVATARTWGSNLIMNFVNGIKNRIGLVINTVKAVAKKVKDYLGIFSPAEKGPLSTADKWMPNLMEMFTHGLEQGIPQLQTAVGDVAMSLAGGGESPLAGSVTNNVNVYPRQANLDARGLNRELERMRYLNGGMF